MIRFTMVLALVATAAACSTPHHLQYDHGRSFQDTLAIQADLSRPSVVLATYALSGEEALALSENATESLTASAGNQGLTINIGDATTD